MVDFGMGIVRPYTVIANSPDQKNQSGLNRLNLFFGEELLLYSGVIRRSETSSFNRRAV